MTLTRDVRKFTDSFSRMQECRETLRMILRHDKVRGKPLLILCNKSDMEESQDEIQVVDELNVERLVNDARFVFVLT